MKENMEHTRQLMEETTNFTHRRLIPAKETSVRIAQEVG
jgi:hypothetical protein